MAPFHARFALWSGALHGLWESAQCPLFYDMSGTPRAAHGALMLGATAGDVAINLGVVAVAGRVVGERSVCALTPAGAAAVLGVSAVAAVGLEWAAQRLGLWRYTERMPTVRVGGHDVGVLPVAQVTLLPVLSLLAARLADRLA